uniref:Uncharacterized protein n=1 Tax=Medicago truncatula TaxID=3880 RepID=Q2HSL5_MEDTR|nr:hypothetical protein MtrDRAFT_AC151521g60v2 [Medicago truncatula]
MMIKILKKIAPPDPRSWLRHWLPQCASCPADDSMREVPSRDHHFSHVLGEMNVTLDDVACLTHLQIEGQMLSHGKKMSKH